MINRFKIISLALLVIGSLSPANALKVEITRGQVKAVPIAITQFHSEGNNEMAVNLAKIITDDLESCGLFQPINPAAFVQDPASLQKGPRFADWRILNAQLLLSGHVEESGGQVKVQFRLFDVFSGSEITGLQFSVDKDKWRRMAHMIADEVYKRSTGEQGYFNTKIAYIDEVSGGKGKNKVRKLCIMDRDGHNAKALTKGDNLVLTPRFSPNNRDIAYLSFENKSPQVFIFNLESGNHNLLGKFEGMSFAPRFSNDASQIIMSLEKSGSSAIYVMDVASKKILNLTPHEAIDTSPCFSPDGKQVVFTSDRGGVEQLYVMGSDGSNVHRISFGGGKYSQPVWSPRGDLIAFTKQLNGQFYIGVMEPDGSNERLITQGYLVEAATWAPNGRVLLFTRESKGAKGRTSNLYTIDLTGRNLRKLNTPRDACDGAWSQLLDKEVNSGA